VPQKIVLKSTTKISLNERFSNLPKVKMVQPSQQQVRPTIAMQQQQQQSTAKNRRLALQMANRPSVAAALKLKKKSLKQRLGSQRLGSDVRSRLSLNNQTNTPQAVRRRGNNTPKRGIARNFFNQSNRGARPNRGQRGALNSVKSFNNRGRSTRNRRGTQVRNQSQGRGQGNTRSFFTRGRGRGQGQRGQGQRGQGQRGRGQRGRGQGRNYMPPSREELDNQLDAYMSQTRTALDAELDAYMADS